MLQTQIRIGQQVSQGRDEWEDILDYPTIETETKKKEPIINYVLPLIFNLDNHQIEIGVLGEYDAEQSVGRYFNVKIQGGNNKAVYTCAEGKKLEQLRKTFFGIPDKKTGEAPEKGQFVDLLDGDDYKVIQQTDLYETLVACFSLRDFFESHFTTDKKGEVVADDKKLLAEDRQLKANERIVLVVAKVIWSEKGWTEPVLFRDIVGYQQFLKQKFLGGETTTEPDEAREEQLCYATGERSLEVGELDLSARYSLNKMFVTTTINYASGWNNADFAKNYQVDKQTQTYLERGSKYLLENYKTRIAGIDHCIIPQLFSREENTDIETTIKRLSRKSDLLFQYEKYDDIVNDLADRDDDYPYWITFLGFESDGNFFKTINVIKDVSKTHFEALIEAFRAVNISFRNLPGVDFAGLMTHGKERTLYSFNLYTVYGMIPVRKDKEKKNVALSLFKQVLEKRSIDRQKLFGYFKELILCHRFERYGSYTNIYPNSAFDFAVRNAVFQYLAFIQVLNQFNLLTTMEDPTPQANEMEVTPIEQLPDYQQRIEAFFDRMQYTDAQKAMFYLGRALNVVAYKQFSKGYETKPVLNKLNYNGMDRDDIVRLRRDLSEKTQQFSLHRLTEFTFGRFTQLFDYNNWPLKPEESLFFILSGYSFFEPTPKK